NSLAQVLLKLTAPGAPDLYQGTELWDLSLVDPDNRRPVDFARRRAALAALEAEANSEARLARCERDWREGQEKLLLIRCALACRARHQPLCAGGDYLPIEVAGARAGHLVAYLRRGPDATVLVAVPRLVAALHAGRDMPDWRDTVLELPERSTWRDAFTGRR